MTDNNPLLSIITTGSPVASVTPSEALIGPMDLVAMANKHVPEHVILVAVTVEAPTRREAHEAVMAAMPTPGNVQVTSWWIAEDERYDGSDNDSAVFCEKGRQLSSWISLYRDDLSAEHNNPSGRPQ